LKNGCNIMKNYYYDEMGNVVKIKKKVNLVTILIIIFSLITAACISLSLYFRFSDYGIRKAIQSNAEHIQNKDINAYMEDLSSKISSKQKVYIRKVVKAQFDQNVNYKIIIKSIKVISKKGNTANVLAKMEKKFIISEDNTKSIYYTLKHELIKENGKYKFYKSFFVSNNNS
jgi:hypothetical protein